MEYARWHARYAAHHTSLRSSLYLPTSRIFSTPRPYTSERRVFGDMSSPATSQASQPRPNVSRPPLRFLHINDPGEAKLPSHRKAVHTHAALYQASQDRTRRDFCAQRKQPRKRKRKEHWPGESIIVELSQTENFYLEGRGVLLPAESLGQTAYQCYFPSIGLLGAGRVDPFQTYPVPWEPAIPQLVDHCSYLGLSFL